MTNAYTLRNHFELREYNTAIDRETFERHFHKTSETGCFYYEQLFII